MKRRMLSGLLAFTLMFSGIPGIASDIQKAGRQGTSETTVSQEATNFSVAIPINLPIDVDRNGVVSTATDVEIKNNSFGPIEVKEIKVSTKLGWGLAEYGKDYRKEKANIKELGLQINDDNVSVDGGLELNSHKWGMIAGKGSMPFGYEATVGVQGSAIDGSKIANVSVVVGWYDSESGIDKPGITISTREMTNQDIVVTIEYQPNANTREYKVGGGEWGVYTEPFTVSGNTIVYARATNKLRRVSEEVRKVIENIDKEAPIITLEDYERGYTNQDIIVRAATDKGTLNQESHKFEENGTFEFIAKDTAGNESRELVSIANINKIKPQITVAEYVKGYTNKDIVVNVSVDKGTLNKGSHTFVENGSFEFIATDKWGNVSKETVTITNINKELPKITVGEYNKLPTNQNVVVDVTTDKGTLNKSSQTFTENGSFEFVATDKWGNINKETVTITNIDKEAPTVPTMELSNTNKTNNDVEVNIIYSEDSNMREYKVGNGGWLNYTTPITITENTVVKARGTDAVGNISTEGSINVENINKIKPVITVGNYTKTPTNKDITVNISVDKGTLNKSSHTFTDNSAFTFIATDEWGNVSSQLVTISNIDKVAPVIIVGNYIETPTNKSITVSATTDKGTLDVDSYTFEKNGIYEFIARDAAGNESRQKVTIGNINKELPKITVGEYNKLPTNKDITVSVSVDKGTLNKSSHTFSSNGSFEFVATDKWGNVSKETVGITNINKENPKITVGDYNKLPINQDIVVNVTTDKGALNKTTHTFIANGSYEFIATDNWGNVSKETVTITNIDKVLPVISIGSYITTPTNQDIVVTATTSKGTLNKGSHTFTSNGSYEFIATDVAGNISKRTVTISNIDKVAPTTPTIVSSKTTPTNENILVTVSYSVDSITKQYKVGNGVWTNYTTPITVTSNTTVIARGIDTAGNISTEGNIVVGNIDKEVPVISIGNYEKGKTNQNITVTATTSKGALNKASHTFTSNGSYEFIATDVAGNVSKETVTITNINKVKPVITVGAYTKTPTNKDITVNISVDKGSLNKNSHTFTNNSAFTFIATDKWGNESREIVTISNIDKVAPIITVGSYIETPTNKSITVSATTDKGTLDVDSYTFEKNGIYEFIARDAAGNESRQKVTIENIVTTLDIEEETFNESGLTKTIELPGMRTIQGITTDSGGATYTVEGNKIHVTITNAEPKITTVNTKKYSKIGTISDTNSVDTFTSTKAYNQDGYTGTVMKEGPSRVISGVYVASENKEVTKTVKSQTNSFANTQAYNEGGFTGAINKDGAVTSRVISGTYTPEERREISEYPSRYYNEGDDFYSPGGLTEYQMPVYGTGRVVRDYLTSGEIEPRVYYDDGKYTGYVYRESTQTLHEGDISATISANGGTAAQLNREDVNQFASNYSTTAKINSFFGINYANTKMASIAWVGAAYPKNGAYSRDFEVRISYDIYSVTYSGEVVRYLKRYRGTLVKEAVDTRVYEYTQNYKGVVNKPATDNRIWKQDYSGTVYKTGEDKHYTHKISIDYIKHIE